MWSIHVYAHTLFLLLFFSYFYSDFCYFSDKTIQNPFLEKRLDKSTERFKHTSRKGCKQFCFIAGCKCHWLVQLSTHPEDKSERHNTCPNDLCVCLKGVSSQSSFMSLKLCVLSSEIIPAAHHARLSEKVCHYSAGT